jgi:TatD DNase family protein
MKKTGFIILKKETLCFQGFKMIDTHAHLDFPDFDKDRDFLIKKCQGSNIQIINPGTNYEASVKAIELANKYKNVYAGVGLHPSDVADGFIYEDYKKLINKKVVAIGEAGLDFWRLPKKEEDKKIEIKKQTEIFIKQLELSDEFDLPIIIHCRVAFEELINILQKRKNSGVIHCFTGNWDQAQQLLKMGYYLGINGIIFKINLKDVIEKCPLEKILLETDCPFLSPPSFCYGPELVEGQRRADFEERNSPLSLPIIAGEIAKIKNVSLEKIIEITNLNAQKLFFLG